MSNENKFVYPATGLRGAAANALVNCRPLLRTRRALLSRLPFLELASDVVNVVYCTWVVDVANVANLVPPGVALSQRNGKALFTILTYAHRHFGPRIVGPFRRLFPSPLQSNWRLYVDTFPGDTGSSSTVLFVKNVFDHPLYAIGTRLFSDALPSHLAQGFEHTVGDGRFRTLLSSGGGSAPDFRCDTVSATDRVLPASLAPFFDSWRSAVTFLCLQHGAIAYVEDGGHLAHARIDLPIDIDTVQALESVGNPIGGDFLKRIGAVDRPFCFVVPKVAFRVLSERLL